MKRIESPHELEDVCQSLRQVRKDQVGIFICADMGCRANGALKVADAFKNELSKNGFSVKVALKQTGCQGFCQRGPLVICQPSGILYQRVKATDVEEIVAKTLAKEEVVNRLLYTDPETKKKITRNDDVPFYAKQHRIVMHQNGRIDPMSIEDYIAVGGYSALSKVLTTMTPEQVIDEIDRSGLRGRGGAGFPTGRKWRFCRKAHGEVKYIICNADEGDPGAFMDEGVLDGNPHSVLEGMIIGAYAIGASEGYIYVRSEYPLSLTTFRTALSQASEYGFLGENILGSGFTFTVLHKLKDFFRQQGKEKELDFNLRMSMGGGAFVCGEETALMTSIEGRSGEPRPKPPFPAISGLWGKPTNINNVETWANVPVIINNGADWYSKIGTENSKGTKVFSLVGKVVNTGLVEVPMGMTLRELIFDIGGGIQKKRKFKAVQTGGPSGGIIPESLIDMPVDYARLAEAGSIMGSGGLIVMDDRTCLVDIAKYFITFMQDESCGKCTPCREGTQQLREILTRISTGHGKDGDIELLEELSKVVKDTSLCGLGQTAPNPILSTLRYFREEYETHIYERKCPAGVCKALVKFSIIQEKCNGCTVCGKVCPVHAISGKKKEVHTLDQEKCTKCGLCYDACKFDSISVE